MKATWGTHEAEGAAAVAAPAAEVTPLLVRLHGIMPSLTPAEQRVAGLVLRSPRDVAALTITRLAEEAETSETSVLRFARRLGFRGYPALRLALAEAAADPRVPERISGAVTKADSTDDIIAKVTQSDAAAVEDTAQQLDRRVLTQVAELLRRAQRIDLFGAGTSGLVARDLQYKLLRLGRPVYAWSDPHLALTSAVLHTSESLAIAFSYSGTSVDAVDFLQRARARGSATVAVTNFPGSQLARAADYTLTTAANESTLAFGTTASRMAALTVVDCLFLIMAQRHLDLVSSSFADTAEVLAARQRPAAR